MAVKVICTRDMVREVEVEWEMETGKPVSEAPAKELGRRVMQKIQAAADKAGTSEVRLQ